MARRFPNWTSEEDEVLIRYAKAYPHNMNRCFLIVSEQLSADGHPRTTAAVSSRWYQYLSHRPDVIAYCQVSPYSISVNRKNTTGTPSPLSLWQRFLNLLHSL